MYVTVSMFSIISTATYYSFKEYYRLKNSGSPDEEYGISPLFAGEFNYYLGLKRTWLAFGMSFDHFGIVIKALGI